ncbi:MAG: hypothetical protein M3065_13555, partial [Actinomycetota bacterium]|nr:hypothetical protein [Actinomycetota bacterium]
MSEPAGLQHPLGIEAVHWSGATGSDLVVRVAGRWRRRRTATTGSPVLAIETEHQRYRFAALPEPPSVRSSQPGLWQVSFRIPASLAPYLAGRLTLMLGSVSISLPPAVADPGEPIAPAGEEKALRAVPDPVVLADRRDRQGELAEHEALRRAGNAEAANAEARALLDWLELELTQARQESERLQVELALAERKRRQAEQLAHSEKAMRLDLGRDHAARIRRHQADARAVLELLDAAQTHAHDVGREIETLRQAAETAGSRGGLDRRTRALAAELSLARSTPPAPVAEVVPVSGPPSGLALEIAMQAIHASRNPRGVSRESATVGIETRLEGALLRLAAERADGEELLGGGPGRERSHEAYAMEAIEAIGRQLAAVRAVVILLAPEVTSEAPDPRAKRAGAGPSDHPAGPAGVVAPDRLTAALDRLREESPAAEPEPDALVSPGGTGGP